MDPMITAAPVPRGALLHKRGSTSSNSSGVPDTCGYLSGDYATPLTCGLGYTCSTGPAFLPSHLGCCNAVDCAPSSGAHTCITATSGTIPCTGESSSDCIEQYTSLLFCTDPTAPACITYSQPPPSSGSAADAGLSPTIFSYSCGPTQTTKIYLATATNAPPSASTHTPISISHLPIYAYVGIGIGGCIVLLLLGWVWRKCTNPTLPIPSGYRCRHCLSTNLFYDTVKPSNPNGNFRRPYCLCTNPSCPNVKNPMDHHLFTGWVSWLDNVGVLPGNPPCRCRRNARMDTAGENAQPRLRGKHFWTCSTGACGYNSWRLDGKEIWGAGF